MHTINEASLAAVGLPALMALTAGSPKVKIGLIDGPVSLNHAELTESSISVVGAENRIECTQNNSLACLHGTFIAGILAAKKTSIAPAICPDCTILIRPIFAEIKSSNAQMPSATPQELAQAIIDCIQAGANILNLSLALANPSLKSEKPLEEALDYAAQRGVITVVAAGNQGALGSTTITRHPWVIPVVANDGRGRPIYYSNLGSSIGRQGVSAPGENITSLGMTGKPLSLGGTSIAAPFVTGAIALLWSLLPKVSATAVKYVITQGYIAKRKTVTPPTLDAWGAYQFLLTT